jgi:hypothetical protein
MRRNRWIVAALLVATAAAVLGVAGCLRLPAFTQGVWDRWAEVGPSGAAQTLRLGSGTLTRVGVGLGCEGAWCAADVSLTDAEGYVVARAAVSGSALEDVTCPIRRPYRWVYLDVAANGEMRMVTLRVAPVSGSEGRLLVRASARDVYPHGEAQGIEGVSDLSFQLHDDVAGFEMAGRLMTRVADMWPGLLAWRGVHAILAGLVAAVSVGVLTLAAAYGLGDSGRPGQNSG